MESSKEMGDKEIALIVTGCLLIVLSVAYLVFMTVTKKRMTGMHLVMPFVMFAASVVCFLLVALSETGVNPL